MVQFVYSGRLWFTRYFIFEVWKSWSRPKILSFQLHIHDFLFALSLKRFPLKINPIVPLNIRYPCFQDTENIFSKLDHRFMIRWIEILVDDHVETLPAFLDRVEINRLDPRRSNRGRENDSCSTGTRSWVPCCFQRDGKITAQNQPGSTQAPHLFRTLQLQFSARLRVGTAGRVQRVTVKDAFTQ